MTEVASLFGERAGAYAEFRPDYPTELFDWLTANCAEHQRALDIACGSGQASVPLGARFAEVLSCDTSLPLLSAGHFPPWAQRIVCDARQLPLTDDCLDLIVVAQALHWFAGSDFFSEVSRTLRPGGLFCAWCYGLAQISPRIDELTTYLHSSLVAAYWPSGRASVDLGYSDIVLPLPPLPAPPQQIRLSWSLNQLLGYLGTWSAVRTCEKLTGCNPLESLRAELTSAWGDAEQPRDICWKLHVIAGRNQ